MASHERKSWVRGSCIGRGSFGTVSIAVDQFTGSVFAVKSVSSTFAPPSAILSLENEIAILKSINSPYVVAYLGDDVTEEPPVGRLRNLHMEYVPRGSLAEFAAGAPMNDEDVRSFARCIASGLRDLHSIGIVHGDVKGTNVLISQHGRIAKLADFGSARRVLDRTGGVQGTPLWMAPEVARGGLHTPESDVWSLGCTVIEIVTRRPPWQEQGFHDAAHALFHIGYSCDLPEFPHQISKQGLDFVEKCLRREPDQRWSCEELLQHPFLAETEQSPRSVFDWISTELQFCEDEYDAHFSSDDFEPTCVDAAKRIGEMAGGRGCSFWSDDGNDEWEVVRSSYAEEGLSNTATGWVEQCGGGGVVARACEASLLCAEEEVLFRMAVVDVYPYYNFVVSILCNSACICSSCRTCDLISSLLSLAFDICGHPFFGTGNFMPMATGTSPSEWWGISRALFIFRRGRKGEVLPFLNWV